MSLMGAGILDSVYGISRDKVTYIPHGVHQPHLDECVSRRYRQSIGGSPLLLTFGLLSPAKGIENMIDALPQIVERYPDVTYLVAGRTHPAVRRTEGESYRLQLVERARRLGVHKHLSFDDRFVSLAEVMLYLNSADLFIAPYVSRDQITSGALSYAVAAGAAVIATPFLHAQEMARRGAVVLAHRNDGASLARQIRRLLADASLRTELQARASEVGSTMLWPKIGRQYLKLFNNMAAQWRSRGAGRRRPRVAAP
jgi:glycosyltransferase involved in cell wall biosynthesis